MMAGYLQHKKLSRKSPWVGYASSTNTLNVSETPNKFRCTVRLGTTLFLFLAGLCLGPAFSAYVYWNPSFLGEASLLAKVAVYGLIIVGWWVFIKGITGSPRFEIERITGDICLYRWRSKRPFAKIYCDSIQNLDYHDELITTRDPSRGTTFSTLNRTLIVVTRDGARIPLCVSPDFDLIERIRQEIQHVAQLKKNG